MNVSKLNAFGISHNCKCCLPKLNFICLFDQGGSNFYLLEIFDLFIYYSKSISEKTEIYSYLPNSPKLEGYLFSQFQQRFYKIQGM